MSPPLIAILAIAAAVAFLVGGLVLTARRGGL